MDVPPFVYPWFGLYSHTRFPETNFSFPPRVKTLKKKHSQSAPPPKEEKNDESFCEDCWHIFTYHSESFMSFYKDNFTSELFIDDKNDMKKILTCQKKSCQGGDNFLILKKGISIADLRKKQDKEDDEVLVCPKCGSKCSFRHQFFECLNDLNEKDRRSIGSMPNNAQTRMKFLYNKQDVFDLLRPEFEENTSQEDIDFCTSYAWYILDKYLTRVLYFTNMHKRKHVKSCFKYAKHGKSDPNCRYHKPNHISKFRELIFTTYGKKNLSQISIKQMQRVLFIYLSESSYAMSAFHPSNHNLKIIENPNIAFYFTAYACKVAIDVKKILMKIFDQANQVLLERGENVFDPDPLKKKSLMV